MSRDRRPVEEIARLWLERLLLDSPSVTVGSFLVPDTGTIQVGDLIGNGNAREVDATEFRRAADAECKLALEAWRRLRSDRRRAGRTLP